MDSYCQEEKWMDVQDLVSPRLNGRRPGRFMAFWLLIACMLSSACSSEPKPSPASILLYHTNHNSLSRSSPSFDVWSDLQKASPKELPSLLDAYIDVVERDHGYARVTALRGLIGFTGEVEHRRYITQRLVNAVAQHATRVAEDADVGVSLRDVLAGPEVPATGMFGETPNPPIIHYSEPWFDRVIDARFEVRIDQQHLVLSELEREGWRFGAVKAWFDGKLILNDANKSSSSRFEVSMAKLAGPEPMKLVGKHVQRMEVQVLSPNGLSAVAECEREFTIDNEPRQYAPAVPPDAATGATTTQTAPATRQAR